MAWPVMTATLTTQNPQPRTTLPSLQLDPRRLHQLVPLRRVRADVRREGVRRAAVDRAALGGALLRELRRLHDRVDLGVELVGDRLRPAGRTEHAEPLDHLVAG